MSSFIWKIIPLAILAASMISTGCSPSGEQPLTAALEAARQGNWQDAEKPSAEALQRTPDNVNALILRALVCEKLQRYDEAVTYALKGVSIDSNSFAALYTLGRLYSMKPDRSREAIDLLIAANRKQPDHDGTLILLCNLNPPGSKQSYLNALAALPGYAGKPEVIFEQNMDRVFRRDRRGVLTAYMKLFNTSKNNPELIYALAGYFYTCGGKQYRPVAAAAYKNYLKFPEKLRTPQRSALAAERLAVK